MNIWTLLIGYLIGSFFGIMTVASVLGLRKNV